MKVNIKSYLKSFSRRSMLALCAIFVVLIFILWKGLHFNAQHLPSLMGEKKVPQFTLPSITDPLKIITEEDLKGQPALLHIWATWCSVCLQEHSELLTIAKKYPYPIYGMSYKDDFDAVSQWLNSQGNPFKITFLDEKGHLGFELGLYGTPETFIVDASGIIRYRHVGMLTIETFEKQMLPQLKNLSNEVKT